MLEPIIVLTALNCFFMFSSTVTTCVLWWQYQSHRCCTKTNDIQQKPVLKKSKSATLRIPKKLRKSDGHVNVSKSSTNGSREHKNDKCPKKKSRKRLQYLAEYQKKNGGQEASLSNEFDSRELNEKSKMSEASQTINDTKSTVVMEFSTVQKVVQIVDDSDINSSRAPLKDIVIQKDTMTKKYDRSTERNFEPNEAVENFH